MILERGNMWDIFGKTGLFLITTNPIRRKDGAVVMGKGIAKEAADRFPDMPFKFGERLNIIEGNGKKPFVNVIGFFDNQMVGFFMVKDHWKNEANPAIIQQSVWDLIHNMRMTSILGEWHESTMRVDLNFPGIGNGRLAREQVLPIIEVLPDNVHVWEYE